MEETTQPTNSQPVISPQTPSSSKNLIAIVILALVAALLASLGTYFVMSSNQNKQPLMSYSQPSPTEVQSLSLTPTPPIVSIQPANKIISTKNSSPDGSYTVTEETLGDYNTIAIKDSKGAVVVDDLVAKNEAEIGMGKKYGCQCGVQFKGWTSNREFVLLVLNGAGEEYEFLVDASTGKVDEASFRRIK